jgi:hypothetical protein
MPHCTEIDVVLVKLSIPTAGLIVFMGGLVDVIVFFKCILFKNILK